MNMLTTLADCTQVAKERHNHADQRGVLAAVSLNQLAQHRGCQGVGCVHRHDSRTCAASSIAWPTPLTLYPTTTAHPPATRRASTSKGLSQ